MIFARKAVSKHFNLSVHVHSLCVACELLGYDVAILIENSGSISAIEHALVLDFVSQLADSVQFGNVGNFTRVNDVIP